MAVALSHGLGGMTHELIDDPLVDPHSRKVAREAVTIRMKRYLEPILPIVQTPGSPTHGAPETTVRPIGANRFRRIWFSDD